jgi:O-antigen/teichoic acid export membrane protein
MDGQKFMSSSILLLLDLVIFSAANWLYWLIILKFTSAPEVGQATIIYNFVVLVGTLIQLGLEYPLLKKSFVDKSHIIWSTLVIELLITVATLPIVIYVFNTVNNESFNEFEWIVIGMLLFTPVAFVSRFVLLGLSDAKSIFIIDTLSTIIRFGTSYAILTQKGELEAFDLLLSILLQTLFLAVATFALANKAFDKFTGTGLKIRYLQEIIKDGLVNMPSKLSGVLIFSLSITLLAFFGVHSSAVATFYIVLIISVVAGSLVSSMGYMLIPASVISKRDLSFTSLRIGISLTVPLIAALVTSPKYILSLIGAQYVSADTILIVLSIGILPYSIVTNAVSKFNYLGESRKILLIGALQLSIFLIAFVLLVPSYGIHGAALSILLAFSASSVPCVIWLGIGLTRYITTSTLAVVAGWTSGLIVGWSIAPDWAAVIASVLVASLIIVSLKNMSISELRQIVGNIFSNSANRNKSLDGVI